MALTCARCGAQNPDGNAFCQACGTPLTAAARVAPPPAPWLQSAPPPPGPPPGPPVAPPPGAPAGVIGPPPGLAPPVQTMGGGYQSPYYVPAVPHAPVHRTPWMLIIAGVIGLVIVMAGCGTVLAIIGSRATLTGSGGVTSGLPSPTTGTPSPLVSPPSTGPTTASNAIASLTVPAGWSVAAKDAVSITLGDPNGTGYMTIEGSRLNAAVTPQQIKDQVDQKLKSQYPDTKPCPNSTTTAITLNNAKGLFWTNCFTYTSGTRAVPEAAAFYASASADGTVYWMVTEVTAPPSNLQSVINECKPIVQGIQWKLT